MSHTRPIRYTSRDGLTINGYLTLPLGREPRNLPCIVNTHGGPWGRDGWGYNAEIQFLANRGYCVLQMNFRGSTGYGRKLMHADKMRAPLFIVQGARYPRVNKAESDQMVEALRKRGVEVQYMVKDNEGHGFRNEENQFEFYEAMEAFFARHLK